MKPVYYNAKLLCHIRIYNGKRQFCWPGADRQWLDAEKPIGNKPNLPAHTQDKVAKMEREFDRM